MMHNSFVSSWPKDPSATFLLQWVVEQCTQSPVCKHTEMMTAISSYAALVGIVVIILFENGILSTMICKIAKAESSLKSPLAWTKQSTASQIM